MLYVHYVLCTLCSMYTMLYVLCSMSYGSDLGIGLGIGIGIGIDIGIGRGRGIGIGRSKQ
jgi:hypothetical protein